MAAATLPGGLRAANIATPPLALFDGRYSDARLFAAAIRSRGGLTLDTHGDVASLWHDRLSRYDITRMTGLTTYADLLMVEDLARAAGLHCGFRVMHDARGSRDVRHSAETAEMSVPDFGSGAAWPIALAEGKRAAGSPGIIASARRSPDHPGTLWSWMYGMHGSL